MLRLSLNELTALASARALPRAHRFVSREQSPRSLEYQDEILHGK